MKSILANCSVIALPTTSDQRGQLTFFEGVKHLPFDIQRIFYLHHVPAAATRAGHAHHLLHEFIVPITGSFDVTLDDGLDSRQFRLDHPNSGLYLCPMVWCTLTNFSAGAVCLVAASHRYDEADYIRDYPSYLAARARHP